MASQARHDLRHRAPRVQSTRRLSGAAAGRRTTCRVGGWAVGSSGPTIRRMKRPLVWLGGLYVLFALIGRFVEGMGAVQCECAPDCWCRRPGLSLFRWVFPRGHRCS